MNSPSNNSICYYISVCFLPHVDPANISRTLIIMVYRYLFMCTAQQTLNFYDCHVRHTVNHFLQIVIAWKEGKRFTFDHPRIGLWMNRRLIEETLVKHIDRYLIILLNHYPHRRIQLPNTTWLGE